MRDQPNFHPPESWLEIVAGAAPLLLIAPHGGRAGEAARATLHPKVNDLETAAITRELARRLGAPALINAGMDRNELDCNRLAQLAGRAPWMLDLIARRVEEIVARHGRATVLLIHGWNIIEPRVDFGLGLREAGGRLHPPAGAHVSASDEFINGPVTDLAAALDAARIQATFGMRYPGGAAQNLLQAFTPRHADSPLEALRRLAKIAAEGAIDALQLEMSVALRLPGALRERSLDAFAKTFSAAGNGAAAPRPAFHVVRQSIPRAAKKTAAVSSAPPSRVGVEFYDPAARLGGMVSFDFGPGAAGGRIMVLFDRRRVALFTAEGKASRESGKISLGPLTLDARAHGGRLDFSGPAVIVDDGAAYLSVERALAKGRLDGAMELAATLCFDDGAPAFADIIAALETALTRAHQHDAGFADAAGAPPHALYGRLRGSISVGGAHYALDAIARVGASFTSLGPRRFAERRMLWACFSRDGGHDAAEARALTLDGVRSHRIARSLRDREWSDCELAHIELTVAPPSSPPARIAAEIAAPGGARMIIEGRPDTFMTLSRPGLDGVRIHTSLGFASYRIGDAAGAGMYEYSRLAGTAAGDTEDK